MATVEPTATAPAAHPDLHRLVFDVEDDLWAALDYIRASMQMLEGLGPISENRRSAVNRVVGDAEVALQSVVKAWRALHEATLTPVAGDAPKASVAPGSRDAEVFAVIDRQERGARNVWDVLVEMENPLYSLKRYASALSIVGTCHDIGTVEGNAVSQIADDIEATVRGLEEARCEARNLCSPHTVPPTGEASGAAS
jgi:hypothetical protein